MRRSVCQRCICVLPIHFNRVVQVHKHHIRDRARAPTIASNARVPLQVQPTLLERPCVVPVPPPELLEGAVVAGIPDVHADFVMSGDGGVGRIARQRSVLVVRIAVVGAVPASLHTNLVDIVGDQVKVVDCAICPDVSGVAVATLTDVVFCVNVENVPL